MDVDVDASVCEGVGRAQVCVGSEEGCISDYCCYCG